MAKDARAATRPPMIAAAFLTFVVLSLYVAGLAAAHRSDVMRQVAYNGPITFVFLVLAAELVMIGWREGWRSLVRQRGSTLAVWLVAAIVLALRFAPTRSEVSGHLTWLPVLTADAWIRGLPVWFLICAGGATAVALYLKFGVFGGPSGPPGIIAGTALAGVLIWTRRRRDKPIAG